MSNVVGKPATAADVAAMAGVSRATVSHILNGRADSFAEATQERVAAAAKALDYRPSPAGRSLVRGRGDTIVVLAPNSTIGQNQQDALDRLIADTASLSGNVVLRFADPDVATTVASLLRLRPLAVVDLGALPQSARDRLSQQGVPTVPDIRRSEPSVHLDVAIARMQAVELQRLGIRRIIYAGIQDRRPDPFSPQRFSAIASACHDMGLEAPVRIDIPIDPDGAYRALSAAFTAMPVGVAAYNDTVALAVASVGRQLNMKIPDELSIVGVDNTPAMRLVSPTLSSIDVNMDAYIDRAVEELANHLGLDIQVPGRLAGEPLTLVRGESS